MMEEYELREKKQRGRSSYYQLLLAQTNRALAAILWGVLFIFAVILAGIAIGIWNESAFVISVAFIAGVSAILVSLLYERFPIYLLVASLPLAEILRVDAIPTTLLIIPGSLAVISLLIGVAFRKKQVFLHSPIIVISILLGAWASLATFMVGSVSEARPYWLVIVLLFLVPNLLTELEHLLRACWLFLLPLGALGAYVTIDRLVFYLSARHISMEALHLARLDVGDKNVVGLWLTIGIPFVYYLFDYYQKEPAKRFWLLLSGIAMIAGVVATLSITALIGLVVMVMMIARFQPVMNTRFRNTVIGILVLVLVVSGPISERLQNQQWFDFDESWGTYRGELWLAGYRAILDHPLFGVGLDPARGSAMMPYINQWFIKDWYNRGILVVPHNIFLSVGVNIGLPGLILYMLLLAAVLFSLLKLKRRWVNHPLWFYRNFPNIILIALIGGWVQGLGLSEHLNKFLWFLMGCTVAFMRIASNGGGIDPAAIPPENPGLP